MHVVDFDFANPENFDLAKSADGVFLLGPPMVPDLFNLLAPFADYLNAQGSKRVVYLSAYGMEAMPELPFHQQMEDKLKASKLDWRVVRPGFFMQNFKNYEFENIVDL